MDEPDGMTMTEEKSPTYDVGWAAVGCVDETPEIVQDQRRSLDSLLKQFGREVEKWATPPRIINEHNHDATVGIMDFGRTLVVNTQPCKWAVLGSLHEQPAEGHVPDGVRLPVRDEGSEQHVGANTGAGDADARHGQARAEEAPGCDAGPGDAVG